MDKAGLPDFIRKVMMEKNLSTYDVARNSGNKINANTVTRLLNGDIKEAKLSTLEAIAEGLGIPAIEMFRVAHQGMEAAQREKREIWIEAFGGSDLPPSEIEEIERTIDFLVKQKLERMRQEAIEEMIEESQSRSS